MDYKDTLNLPRTDFPMKADLVAREPLRLEKWDQERLYESIQARRAGAEKFILHDGPPFANGDVHIGTALNKVLKDVIVKYHTLRGKHAPYVPGWDCHGLPIEFKVSQEMRKAAAAGREDAAGAGPAMIRKACDAYARKYIDIQRAQFKRLGVLGDWANPYLTLNKEYEADELRLFADIVEQGFVYRGKKPVYWSIPCRTALAEAEVEYQDHVSQSIFVKFPVMGHPQTYILIWTTTPWTLPANLAVAYNSTFSYAHVRVGRETYILSSMLLSAVSEKCGWGGYEILRSLDADHLSQVEYQHPFCQRTGRLLAGDEFVDNTTGTGFVHIAPGHGLEDYQLGLRHGLPVYSPVDDDGRFTLTNDLPREQQMPADLVGKSILEKHGKSEANEAVLHELRARQALVHQENYHHSYPHCWKSKTPVIFRAMDQWFIRVDHIPPRGAQRTFRELAIEAIHSVQWIPEWGKNRIEAAVKARPDWCISRQRTWGVPIPAFCDAQGNPLLDPQVVRNAADLIESHGSNVWFERSAAELWTALKPKGWTGPEPAAKSSDTLDVWIDSGSSSRAVLMRRPELQRAAGILPAGKEHSSAGEMQAARWQADLYIEGSDQHRGWFQSSLLLSLAGNGTPPYKSVLTHGFIVDADRDKISKSKQSAYEKPQTSEAYVSRYGADVVRLWLVSQDFRTDVIVSEERINKVSEAYRLLRNTLRYQLSNLYDFDPTRHAVPEDKLTGLDRWILHEFAKLEADVSKAYDACEFHVVYQKVSQFAAVELSAIYHDVVKDRLYTDRADSPRRRSTQTALHRMVTRLCQMLSPILAFTADEAWEFVPLEAKPESVHLSCWTPSALKRSEDDANEWLALFQLRELILPELEKARRRKIIGKSLDAKLVWWVAEPELQWLTKKSDLVREILNLSGLTVLPSDQKEAPPEHAFPLRLISNPYTGGPIEALLDPLPGVYALVGPADGQKCERCWHWETDVGSNVEHPTICARCVAAIK